MRCEYLTNPVGIDVTEPRLSWRLESEVPGEKQTAYHVLVASSRDGIDKGVGDLWDSGKVESDQSIHITYAGQPLISKMTCYWKVRTWGKDGKPSTWSQPSRWTMGLLNPSDWTSQWISAPTVPPTPPVAGALIVKKATYRTLDGKVAVDVTEIIRKELANNKPFTVDCNKLGGDPAPNVVKELLVEYVRNGKPAIARARDFAPLNLSGTSGDPGKPAPMFRREFELVAAPDSAWVTVHSPGYFELYINGRKVGTDVLSPAVSKLDKQSFSLSYDVSSHLRPGRNCIGLWCSVGWAKSVAVRAQLDATVNGKPVNIGTDTTWKTHQSGYYRIGKWKWGDFGGERMDARKLIPCWSKPGLDTGSWKPALAAKGPGGETISQPCPPNRIGEEIPAVAVTSLNDGRYKIDFGTALTGWLRLKMPILKPGAVVKMTFADALPGEALRGQEYQHFKQFSEFISAGKAGEVFEHKFNYAAFRYVLIDGLSSAPAKEDATALLVESDLEMVGGFECSNELFNRIHKVNQWTQRCLDLGGYYVDCPHRERMGYGDGQVAVEGFMTSFRADGYYRKILLDWRLIQKPNGDLPHSAPFGKGGGGPGWGGLVSAITWRHYLYYADRRVLEENYETIRRYVDFLDSLCKDGVMRKFGGKWSFIGDWVPPRRGMDTKNWPGPTAAELFNNCYHIFQMELLERMADVLGKVGDATRYRKRLEEIRPLVHQAYFDSEKNMYVIDEQAYYVMPLLAGVTPDHLRASVLKNLEHNILEKNKGHLDTGMMGTYFMMEYLREIGRNDLVFEMFNQKTYPGWGYMVEKGATTMWEQWNGYWSRVHSCFTSPDNWFYQGLGGIQADRNAPGFKNVIINPAFVDDLTWVKAYHTSPYGRIVSNWHRENDRVTMEVTIPANSSATIHVPARVAGDVTVNGQALMKAEHVTFSKMERKRAVLHVGSGNYIFISTRYNAEPKR